MSGLFTDEERGKVAAILVPALDQIEQQFGSEYIALVSDIVDDRLSDLRHTALDLQDETPGQL